jgi:hypothetical protein
MFLTSLELLSPDETDHYHDGDGSSFLTTMDYGDEIIRRDNHESRGNGQLKHKAKFWSFGGLPCTVCGELFGCQPDPETDEMLCKKCQEAKYNEEK